MQATHWWRNIPRDTCLEDWGDRPRRTHSCVGWRASGEHSSPTYWGWGRTHRPTPWGSRSRGARAGRVGPLSGVLPSHRLRSTIQETGPMRLLTYNTINVQTSLFEFKFQIDSISVYNHIYMYNAFIQISLFNSNSKLILYLISN